MGLVQDFYTNTDVLKIKQHIKKYRPNESDIYAYKYFYGAYDYDFVFAFTNKAFYCFGWGERFELSKSNGHSELEPLKNLTTRRHRFKAYKRPCQCVIGRLPFEKIKSINRIESKRYPNIKPFSIKYFKSKENEVWETYLNNSETTYPVVVQNYMQNWKMATTDYNKGVNTDLLLPYKDIGEATKVEHYVTLFKESK